jgi:hypothetical protein
LATHSHAAGKSANGDGGNQADERRILARRHWPAHRLPGRAEKELKNECEHQPKNTAQIWIKTRMKKTGQHITGTKAR